MIYLKNYSEFVFESSSLTKLNINNDVMKYIQYNYELKPDANWNKITKTELKKQLKVDEKSLFILLYEKNIKLIFNINLNYSIQIFEFDDKGFGQHMIRNKTKTTLNDLLNDVLRNTKIYKLDSDKFIVSKKDEKLKKELKEFDNITNDFKFKIIGQFNNIIKKLYNKKYDDIIKKISFNMKDLNHGLNQVELEKVLRDNEKLVDFAKQYKIAKNDNDIKKIKNLNVKCNSLTNIDEFLISFEEEYSQKYKTRLTIPDLIKEFGLSKIQTSFIYFLHSGKIQDLKKERYYL